MLEGSTPPIPMNVGRPGPGSNIWKNPQNPTGVGLVAMGPLISGQDLSTAEPSAAVGKIRYTHLYQHPRHCRPSNSSNIWPARIEYLREVCLCRGASCSNSGRQQG